MTRAEFDQMMERNFRNFEVPDDNYGGLILWLPEYNQFLSMHFGDGTNCDTLEEGCEDYIYYTQFDIDNGTDVDWNESIDLEEVDGGQMDIPSADEYDCNIKNVIPDMLQFIYGKYTEVIPIQFYSV